MQQKNHESKGWHFSIGSYRKVEKAQSRKLRKNHEGSLQELDDNSKKYVEDVDDYSQDMNNKLKEKLENLKKQLEEMSKQQELKEKTDETDQGDKR
ncbi:MAG: hypothetical protein R3A12_04975 [Ignavibacteria bacterium]